MKNLTFILVFFTALLVPVCTRAADSMPAEIATFLERSNACEHWADEEPYDVARSKEIDKSIEHYKCETLDDDRAVLLKKYANSPSVTEALNNSIETD